MSDRIKELFNKRFSKVVLWGFKDPWNTFYYVHQGYYRAFRHLGIEVLWLEDKDDVSKINFSGALTFVEGQTDRNVPIRDDCFYIMHNCYDDKYKPLKEKRKTAIMQTYTDDCLKYENVKLSEGIHADYNGRALYFFWPTDILPHEINQNKPTRVFNNESKVVTWVGTVGGSTFGNEIEIAPFKKALAENGIAFKQIMGIGLNDNIDLIKASYCAPVITGTWQTKVGYVPCRAAKNLSYGQMIATNSPRIYEIFDRKIVYNQDTYQLFFDFKKRLETMQLSELHELIDYVRDNHTYINRIETVLEFIEKIS